MLIAFKLDHREFELNTDGSLAFTTTHIAVHVCRDPVGSIWPYFEHKDRDEGLWYGFGFRVAYSRLR